MTVQCDVMLHLPGAQVYTYLPGYIMSFPNMTNVELYIIMLLASQLSVEGNYGVPIIVCVCVCVCVCASPLHCFVSMDTFAVSAKVTICMHCMALLVTQITI